jgi:hypothetical protein
MRNLLIICLLLFNPSSLKLTSKSSYDYSNYKYISKDENLSEKTLSSTNPDESVVYATNSVESVIIQNSNINKESGDSSKIEDSEKYGVNSAILSQGCNIITITGGQITSKAKGASGLFLTNEANGVASNMNITTSGESSCGLVSTYGSVITAQTLTVTTNGDFSHATSVNEQGLRILCKDRSTFSTKGKGSHLAYLVGEQNGSIEFKNSIGTSDKAKIAVIAGTNAFSINEKSEAKCSAAPNEKESEQCGIMLYQTRNKYSNACTFTCNDATIEILQSSEYYSTAPMFFVTNTESAITLEKCQIKYGSNKFLDIRATDKWGNKGNNGGGVALVLTNQNIEGDLTLDVDSSLTIRLKNSSITGKINPTNTAKFVNIVLDESSTITIRGNSYCTTLSNEKTDGSNLINGTYKWTIGSDKKSSAEGIFKSNLFMIALSLILNILVF